MPPCIRSTFDRHSTCKSASTDLLDMNIGQQCTCCLLRTAGSATMMAMKTMVVAMTVLGATRSRRCCPVLPDMQARSCRPPT